MKDSKLLPAQNEGLQQLNELSSRVLANGHDKINHSQPVCRLLLAALNVQAVSLFIWDKSIETFYILADSGDSPLTAELEQRLDAIRGGQAPDFFDVCSKTFCYRNANDENAGNHRLIGLQFDGQWLGAIGFSSDACVDFANSAELLAALSHYLLCVRSALSSLELDLKGRELLRISARLEQVLAKNIEHQHHIEEIAAALKIEAEKANRANRAKSDFLSSMSHELRTPLNAVIGFSQLLLLDDLTAEQEENVRYIFDAGNHLLGLINNLLDLTKIESGKLVLNFNEVSLHKLIAECMALIKPLADKQQIQLNSSLGDADIVLKTDPMRLKQVLINLLSNAVKYNKPQGQVTLELFHQTGQPLRITVQDTGIGISAEQIPLIFEPFERLSFYDSGIEGTGIGLGICKQLTELLGGTLDVSSQLGIGSRFWVELPPPELDTASQ